MKKIYTKLLFSVLSAGNRKSKLPDENKVEQKASTPVPALAIATFTIGSVLLTVACCVKVLQNMNQSNLTSDDDRSKGENEETSQDGENLRSDPGNPKSKDLDRGKSDEELESNEERSNASKSLNQRQELGRGKTNEGLRGNHKN